jgi:hypothetical protein
MRRRNLHEWMEIFKGRLVNVDVASYGLPSTETCVGCKQQVDQCIWDNRRISADEIKSEMNLS